MNAMVLVLQNNPWLLALIVAWSVLWKALALWHAARNSHLVWYIALLVVNTIGILEIIYLLFFRNKKHSYFRLS